MKARWVTLAEVYGRSRALLIDSFLKAHGVETHLVQEAYYAFKYSADLGFVQILVPDYQFQQARKLYKQSGWKFDTRGTDEDGE